MHSRFLFSALLTFAFRGRAETAVFRLGSSFLTQNTTSYIKDVNISIIVPPAPSGPNQSVDAFNLFPMIGCDMANNILRPSMNIFEDMAGYCNATRGQWCLSNALGGYRTRACGPPSEQSCSVDADPAEPPGGGGAIAGAARPGDTVAWRFAYDDRSRNFSVAVRRNGRELSSRAAAMGRGKYFHVGADAEHGFFGPVGPFTFNNITIRLAAPDPQFGRDPVFGNGAGDGPTSAGNLATADGGLTWTMPRLDLFKYNIPAEAPPRR